MIENSKQIKGLIEKIELPDSAYIKARERYEDLGDWLSRKESTIAGYDPHIFPQGSFRLGTAIRPLDESEEYDLDLACNLRTGILKRTHTQSQLKALVGDELEVYRAARSIQEKLKPKHRCWRLEYQDHLSFHMDIVPCIPAEEERKQYLLESMRKSGFDDFVATSVAGDAVSITDDRHARFHTICEDWNPSNPAGYAKWFEDRTNPKRTRMLLSKAQVDEVPFYRYKLPLQRVVQLLKRHRDSWSKDNPESKPISIIISTLAARAYSGETDIAEALLNILSRMGRFVNDAKPRIPNPINHGEDFADRWYREDSQHLYLEQNFWSWLAQAQADFKLLTTSSDFEEFQESAELRLSLRLDKEEVKTWLPKRYSNIAVSTRKTVDISAPPKPWGFHE